MNPVEFILVNYGVIILGFILLFAGFFAGFILGFFRYFMKHWKKVKIESQIIEEGRKK